MKKIEAQQKGKEGTPAWMVGEQLKEEQARIRKARQQYRPPVWKREEKVEWRVGKG